MKALQTLPSLLCFHFGVFAQSSSLQDVVSQINSLTAQQESSGNSLANISSILGGGLTSEGINTILQQLTSGLGGLNSIQNQVSSVLGTDVLANLTNQIQNGQLLTNLTSSLGTGLAGLTNQIQNGQSLTNLTSSLGTGLAGLTNIGGVADNALNELASSLNQILGGNSSNGGTASNNGTIILNTPTPESGLNGGINLQNVGAVDPVSLLSDGVSDAKNLLSLLGGTDSAKLISLLGTLSNTLNSGSNLDGLVNGLSGTTNLGNLGTNLINNLGLTGIGGLLTTSSSTLRPTGIDNTLDSIAATMITDNYLNSAGQNAIRLSGLASKAMMYPDLALALEGQMPVVDGTGKLTSSVVGGLSKLGITATTPGELLSAAMGSVGTPAAARLLIESINDDPLRSSLLKFNKSLQEAIDVHEGPHVIQKSLVNSKEYNSWLGDMWGKVTGNEDSGEAGSDKWKGDVKDAATDLANHLQKMADDLRNSDVPGMLEKWWENNGGKAQRRLMDRSGSYYQNMYSGCGNDCRSATKNARLRGYGKDTRGYVGPSNGEYSMQPHRFDHYRGGQSARGQSARNQYGFVSAGDPSQDGQILELSSLDSQPVLSKSSGPEGRGLPYFQFQIPRKGLQQFQTPRTIFESLLIPDSNAGNAFGLPSQLNSLFQPFVDTLEDIAGPLFNPGGFGQALGMRASGPDNGSTENRRPSVGINSNEQPKESSGYLMNVAVRPGNYGARALQAQQSSYSPELIEKLQQMLGSGSIELHSLGKPGNANVSQPALAIQNGNNSESQGLAGHVLQNVEPESLSNAISLIASTAQNTNPAQNTGQLTQINGQGVVAQTTGQNVQSASLAQVQEMANAVNLLASSGQNGSNATSIGLETPMNGALLSGTGSVGGVADCDLRGPDRAGILNNLDLTKSIDSMSAERVAEVFQLDKIVVDNLPLIDNSSDTRSIVADSFKTRKFADGWAKVNLTALPGLEQSDATLIRSAISQGKFGSLLGKLRLHKMSGLENMTVGEVQQQIISDNLATLLPHLGYYLNYDDEDCNSGQTLQGVAPSITDDIEHGASLYPSINANGLGSGASVYPNVDSAGAGAVASDSSSLYSSNRGMQQLSGSEGVRQLREDFPEIARSSQRYNSGWSDNGRSGGTTVLGLGNRVSSNYNRVSDRKTPDLRNQSYEDRRESRKWQEAGSLPDVLSYVNNDPYLPSPGRESGRNDVSGILNLPEVGSSFGETGPHLIPGLNSLSKEVFNPYAGIPGLEGLSPPPHPYAGIPGLEDMKIAGINAPFPGVVYPARDIVFQKVGLEQVKPIIAESVGGEAYSVADILGTLGESDYSISDLLAELNKSGMDLNQLFSDSATTGISLDRILKSLSNANVDVKKFLQDINRSNVDVNRLVHQLAHSKITLDDTLKTLTLGGLDYNAMVHQLVESGMDVNNLIKGARLSGVDMDSLVKSNALPQLVSSGVLSSAGISGLLGGIAEADTLNPHALLTAGNQGIAMVDILHDKVTASASGSSDSGHGGAGGSL